MKEIKDYKPIIIAQDQGNGNHKTVHTCITTGVEPLSGEAIASTNVLVMDGKSYVIGEKHLTYRDDKTSDNSFYIMGLSSIAEEMMHMGFYEANVILAEGLPLNFLKAQGKAYKEYLMQNPDPEFEYKGHTFKLHISNVLVFPQGLSAMALMGEIKGDIVLVDIGNGTMDLALFQDGKPIESSLVTEEYGVAQCVNNVKKAVSKTLGRTVDERRIESIIKAGCSENDEDKIALITKKVTEEYANEILRRVRAYGYDDSYMKLYIIGGGGCILKNFSDISENSNVIINEDIHINAKGYEKFAKQMLNMGA